MRVHVGACLCTHIYWLGINIDEINKYEIFIFTIKSSSAKTWIHTHTHAYTHINTHRDTHTDEHSVTNICNKHISIYIFKCLSKMPKCIRNARRKRNESNLIPKMNNEYTFMSVGELIRMPCLSVCCTLSINLYIYIRYIR